MGWVVEERVPRGLWSAAAAPSSDHLMAVAVVVVVVVLPVTAAVAAAAAAAVEVVGGGEGGLLPASSGLVALPRWFCRPRVSSDLDLPGASPHTEVAGVRARREKESPLLGAASPASEVHSSLSLSKVDMYLRFSLSAAAGDAGGLDGIVTAVLAPFECWGDLGYYLLVWDRVGVVQVSQSVAPSVVDWPSSGMSLMVILQSRGCT